MPFFTSENLPSLPKGKELFSFKNDNGLLKPTFQTSNTPLKSADEAKPRLDTTAADSLGKLLISELDQN